MRKSIPWITICIIFLSGFGAIATNMPNIEDVAIKDIHQIVSIPHHSI